MAKWTIAGLYRKTVRVSSTRKQYASSTKRMLDRIIPYAGTKSVLFQFSHYGMTVQAIHHVNIMFIGVDIQTEPQSKDTHLKVEYKGKTYWVEKPDVEKTQVRVRCSCVDFRHTFSYWNWKNGALFGNKSAAYKRKSKTRKERNPLHTPGFCKHVFNSIQLMQTSGYTKANRKSR